MDAKEVVYRTKIPKIKGVTKSLDKIGNMGRTIACDDNIIIINYNVNDGMSKVINEESRIRQGC